MRPGCTSSRDIGPEPQARSSTSCDPADTARASQRYGEWSCSPANDRDRTASMTPARSRWNAARYCRQLATASLTVDAESDPGDEQVGRRLAVDLAPGRTVDDQPYAEPAGLGQPPDIPG